MTCRLPGRRLARGEHHEPFVYNDDSTARKAGPGLIMDSSSQAPITAIGDHDEGAWPCAANSKFNRTLITALLAGVCE